MMRLKICTAVAMSALMCAAPPPLKADDDAKKECVLRKCARAGLVLCASSAGNALCRSVCEEIRSGDDQRQNGACGGQASEFFCADPTDDGCVGCDRQRLDSESSECRKGETEQSAINVLPAQRRRCRFSGGGGQ